MSDSESYSDEDHLNDTIVDKPTPTKSVSIQNKQLINNDGSSPFQNTRSSGKKLFQSRLTSSSVKMTEKRNQTPIFTDPKPLENPILENPLETFFEPSLTREEMDEELKPPYMLTSNSSQEEKAAARELHHVNRLKKDRSNIYSSITKMSKSIINVMNGKSTHDWEELENRAITANKNLWEITKRLHDANINISAEEDEKFWKYDKVLNSHIVKIQAHIRSQNIGIPALMLAAEKAFKPEPEQQGDGMNEYADRNRDTDETAEPENMDQVMKALMQQVIKLSTSSSKKTESDYRSLKPIEIQPFSGDTRKYHYFKESFKAANEWRNLPQKMLALQLQSHLKGPALKLCQDHLKNKIDENSYNTIWKALETRYGGSFNEDASITEQFEKLPVLRNMSFKELERTHDTFKLQADYYQREDRNALHNIKSILNKQAKAKLSVDIGFKYVEWCADQNLPENFTSMLEWLRIKYEVAQKSNREYNHSAEDKQTDRQRNRITLTRDNESSDDEKNQTNRGDDSEEEEENISFRPQDSTYWVNPKSGGKPYPWNGRTNFPRRNFDPTKTVRFEKKPLQLKPTDTCILCNVRHEMSECPKFKVLSLKEKKLIVRSSVLCFHCLSTKHFLKDCKTNKDRLCDVRNCKLYHHPLLHAEKLRVNAEYTLTDMTSLTEEEYDSISHLFADSVSDSVNHIAQKGSISLQTVVCNVTSGSNYIKTVALLDTGSTMTAIDEDFAFNNNLKIIGKRDGQEVYVIDRLVKMKGFQYKVELTVSSVENDTSTRIEAWTIKNLVQNCGIVDWSERKRDFPHLRRIKFPKLPENPKITILFGCNVTRMFKSVKTIVDENNKDGPVAMKTFLGWTCVGNSANPAKLRKDPTSELINILLKAGEEN